MAFPSSSGWTLSLNVSQLEQESYPSRPTRSDYSPSQLRPTQQQQSNLSPTTTPSSTRSSLIESANTSLSQSTHKARLLSNQELQKMRDESEGNKEDLNRVISHASNLEQIRQFEQTQYLEQLSQAQSKIAQLESRLSNLSSFRTESSQVDWNRLRVDNDQLTRQAEVLARKLQFAGSSQSGLEKEEKGESGEEGLREENKKLSSDVKYLELRLQNSESQACRLSTELRRLRPYYLQGSPLVVHDAEVALLDASALKPGSRAVLLGDAESELLLQAGKSHSHVRRIQRIPIDKAIQLQAEEIVAAQVPEPLDYIQAHPQPHHHQPQPQASSSSSHSHTAPPQPSFQLPVPPSLRNRRSDHSDHTATSSHTIENAFSPEFDPLTFPHHPELSHPPPPPSSRPHSPSSNAFSPAPTDSHASKRRRLSQSQEIPSTQVPSSFGLPLVAPVTAIPPPPPTPSVGKPIGRTPSALDLLSEAAGAMRSGGGEVQGPNGVSYNPRSRKPKIDANGEKKARSPYIKWKVEEDEQLLKAVISCGCAWDSVAKLCPTRAYHQVRQRFLRGLRSGETLPAELLYLQGDVRKAVADYEARKKRKRPARQLSVGLYDDQDPLLAHYHASQREQMDEREQEGGGEEMEDEEYDE